MSILAGRLQSHLLAGNALATPQAVVSHLTAVQAQDFLGALWGVGVRMPAALESDVERALDERTIVRCWPMRGTLHFVAAEDVRWMLELLAPRVLARHQPRLQREFGVDTRTLRRCRTLVERALQNDQALTRPEIYAILQKAKISTANSRGLHILFVLAHERVICFGPRRGKQPTFVLLDEWVPQSKPRSRDDALGELASRYLRGHGPATPADFAWWSGLSMKEAKEALSLAHPTDVVGDAKQARASVHLLPPFDEYTVAYKDRSPIVDAGFAKRVNAGGGILNAVLVVDGRVAGTWKRSFRGDAVEVTVSPFRRLSSREESEVEREASRYAKFLGVRLHTCRIGRV
jgi:hypothetical protein